MQTAFTALGPILMPMLQWEYLKTAMLIRLIASLFFIFLWQDMLWGQAPTTNPAYRHQIGFRHDNDFLFSTDRYYSSGLYLQYRARLTKGFFGPNEQWGLRLGQEVYTPAQTQSTNSAFFDRPYAGFTGLLAEWSRVKNTHLLSLETLLGLAGNNSGAGGFQRWFHRVAAIKETPLWTDEINNRLHLNFYITYTKEWELLPKPSGLRLALQPKLALGTRDAFIQAGNILYIGKRDAPSKSMAYQRVGYQTEELFFTIHTAVRQVWHNGLIQGHLFRDLSPVLRPITNTVLLLGLDLNHSNKRHNYAIGLRLSTKEAPKTRSHTYLRLAYGHSW